MSKIIVVGSNRFVGFHLCTSFLNDGIEVKGYMHEPHKSESFLQDEMRSFLGRNANFTSVQIDEADQQLSIDSDTDVVYFTYFDAGDFHDSQFLRHKMKEANEALIQTITKCRQTKTKLVFLSSLRVFGEEQKEITEETVPIPDHREGKLMLHFEKMIEKAKSSDLQCMTIRVPTIYGPWQPLSMAYQHALIHKEKKEIIEEDTRHVLYIDDVVNALKSSQQASIKYDVVHLVNKQDKDWGRGAQLLNIKEIQEKENEFKESERAKEILNFYPKVSIREGMYQQMRHTRTIFSYRS
ncbi:NAD-dependent epimerase/dehydratase family protein [Metabacillus iocasae]|uniref:Nucleoside-diphosphate-sugar epimerase n=1 Tax=Priestia iocasae TaxID=2291674 RepID=A0ABS2QSZ2_9BACI|nr:NAD(P)-dependent oxidoreductase [Metabacillus iocasae]MBM7702583.1 nucleoside-diphosphate-sugar epimerase [Metabacillus iocasae]